MKKILLLLIVLMPFLNLNAQKDTIQLAEDLIYNEDFSNAIHFYKRLVSFDPKNPEFYYKLGFCYLNTLNKQDSAVEPLRISYDLFCQTPKNKLRTISTSPLEVEFNLARAYRLNLNFDSAIYYFNDLKPKIKNKHQIDQLNYEIKICNDSKELVDNPVKNIQIINLGIAINSEYTEHSAVVNPDETEIFFTSRKKFFPNADKFYDGEYDENIYSSTKDSSGNWNEAKPVMNINTTDFEATMFLSYDGSKLFIYKDDEEGSIYVSEYQNNDWTAPIKLDKPINSKYRESHACLSYDRTTLYFTSNRPGGQGGMDIYMSKRMPDSSWGPALNLGPAINSEKDEEAPFIMPDGVTLYFSSKGHGGMGGYDIFSSTLQDDGSWSIPSNIGYPINSPDDDIFYFFSQAFNHSYFASNKGSDNFGKTDIYLMVLPDTTKSNLVVMTGKLAVCEGKLPTCDILITDNTNGNYYFATPKNGKFIFVTQRKHNYTVHVEVKGSQVFDESFDVAQDAPNVMLYKVIRLDPEVPCSMDISISKDDLIDPRKIDTDGSVYDNVLEVENILFPMNQVGKISSNSTLDTLVNYLKRNPNAVTEVGGYCDASGKADYNLILSVKRATAVRDYLVNKGVSEKQVVVVGYGEENPITLNKNKDGSWNKFGQNFNRRVEFRILKQGDETILIKGMKVPDNIKNQNYKFNYIKAATNIECNN